MLKIKFLGDKTLSAGTSWCPLRIASDLICKPRNSFIVGPYVTVGAQRLRALLLRGSRPARAPGYGSPVDGVGSG